MIPTPIPILPEYFVILVDCGHPESRGNVDKKKTAAVNKRPLWQPLRWRKNKKQRQKKEACKESFEEWERGEWSKTHRSVIESQWTLLEEFMRILQ